jgi:hypothetical protein
VVHTASVLSFPLCRMCSVLSYAKNVKWTTCLACGGGAAVCVLFRAALMLWRPLENLAVQRRIYYKTENIMATLVIVVGRRTCQMHTDFQPAVRHSNISIRKLWLLGTTLTWMRGARSIVARPSKVACILNRRGLLKITRAIVTWSHVSSHWPLSRPACPPVEFCVLRAAVVINRLIFGNGFKKTCMIFWLKDLIDLVRMRPAVYQLGHKS